MKVERIYLDKENPQVFMDAYISDKIKGLIRDAVLIIPGGGYDMICDDREGEPIAQAFIPYGFNAFVLHYSVKKDKKTFPRPLIDASLAICYIRKNAEKYGIDKNRVFMCGFSAGGHLAGCLGTLWDKKELFNGTNVCIENNKPNGVMLIYPVVSYEYHTSSINNLFGGNKPSEEMIRLCSLENNVDKKSAPLFIFHTSNDDLVDVRNSLVLANAYKRAGLMFEMHIYPNAPHGVALANGITECGRPEWNDYSMSKWVENAVLWTKNQIIREDNK